jgi:hypothetical protein
MTAEEGLQQPAEAPKPEPQRIAALIRRIERGDIKLPTFQRPQVWNVRQVIDLLDSVDNGYPVGSLLFWLTDHRLGAERDIGGFSLPDTPDRYPRNYVLDGQQRLTTLYAVLNHPPDHLDERLRVAYDLENQEFVEAQLPLDQLHLPLNWLYDTRGLRAFWDQLRTREDGEELIAETERLWETFHDYVVPVVTVPDMPVSKVGVIFERINSRGTRLTVFDLMVAATWGSDESGEFNLRESVDVIIEQLDEKDFGGIDPVSVLRSLAVAKTGSARRQAIIDLRDYSREDLELLIEKTRAALSRAVDFLTSEVSVVSNDFLPYERQLVLLAYVMTNRSSLSGHNFDVLRRWFWRTSFAERYRAGGEARFDDDLRTTLGAIETSDGLERFGKAPDRNFFIGSEFRKGSAASQAFAALLGAHRPRNITNGAFIDVGTALSAYNRKEFHHLFPQKVLKNWDVQKGLISSLANICMLASSENKKISDRPPSEYIKSYQSTLGMDQFDEVMASNLIPPAAVDALLKDDFARFLEARADFLSEVVADLV